MNRRNDFGGVFFDVDGVLLDSLPQHLAICTDKAKEYGLNLEIPDVAAFRLLVKSGVKVSPMLEFFRAVGFPLAEATRAVVDYERDFMSRYRPEPFPGIDAMLSRLSEAGFALGLVTANTSRNVEPALRDAMRFFDPRLLFFVDSFSQPRSKAWCLNKGASILGRKPSNCIFIGDQPADAAAAEASSCRFLGVTYGWGITPDDPHMRTVNHVSGITDAVLDQLVR